MFLQVLTMPLCDVINLLYYKMQITFTVYCLGIVNKLIIIEYGISRYHALNRYNIGSWSDKTKYQIGYSL